MSNIHHLSFPLEIKALEESGKFNGYASVFSVVDQDRDVILPGAFRQTLKTERDIKLLWQHRSEEPIGVITHMEEDDHGLYVEGRLLLDIARAREAYALLKAGTVRGLSIGYHAVDYTMDETTGTRQLRAIDLWEISLVTFPANPLAAVRTVKSALPATTREFEHFLREAGFSRNRAKAIATAGFDLQHKQRDAAEENAAALTRLCASIDRAIQVLLTP
ncbi:MAG: HK97 family phage prohead protease [Rickettsiales bacterium]|nr:HK97 family phage prohead protease [Rickettsiales bacterium]